MRLGKIRPIRRPIPLTPLIDVVFLLLLFFMLSSTFAKMQQMDIDTRGSTTGQPDSFPGALVDLTGAGQVIVNGKRMPTSELTSALDKLHAAGVARAVLVPRQSASVQDLVSAMEAARASLIASFSVVRK